MVSYDSIRDREGSSILKVKLRLLSFDADVCPVKGFNATNQRATTGPAPVFDRNRGVTFCLVPVSGEALTVSNGPGFGGSVHDFPRGVGNAASTVMVLFPSRWFCS